MLKVKIETDLIIPTTILLHKMASAYTLANLTQINNKQRSMVVYSRNGVQMAFAHIYFV